MKRAAVLLLVSACAADAGASDTEMLETRAGCTVKQITFGPEVYWDLKRSIAPAFVVDNVVAVPRALVARSIPPEGSENQETLVDAVPSVTFGVDEASGLSAAVLGGDAAARLYAALELPARDGVKTSRGGLVTCRSGATCALLDVGRIEDTNAGDPRVCR